MAQFEHGFALLVGVDENNVPDWSLPAVTNDIAALEKVLTDPSRCAYPPEQVKTITGNNATRQGIVNALEWLQEQVQSNPSGNVTVAIHYSGHGFRDDDYDPPRYYLIPYDVTQDNIRSRALRADDFADAIKALAPRRLLVTLDCCHAGGMEVRDIKLADAFRTSAIPPELLIDVDRAIPATDDARGLEMLEQGHGRAVLSASQGEQKSYNRRDGKMGIFTYHLLEALTGHAQPQEGASEVLVSDVMSYVWRKVPQSAKNDWGRDQQPDYQLSGNFPVALLLGGRGLGFGETPPNPLDISPVEGPKSGMQINTGGGAYVDGNVSVNGEFVGRDKNVYGDEVRGDKVGGDKITVGNISGSSGIAIGRNARATVTTGISGADLDKLFAPIFLALQDAPSEQREEAVQNVNALKEEVAKGDKSDDDRMASLLEGLIDLVPGAVSAVASAFTTPVLAVIAGPVTKHILKKFSKAG